MSKPTPKDWNAYYKELFAYTTARQQTRPRRYEYATKEEFEKAFRQWEFAFHCDKPNKPGYEFANND